MAIQVAAGIIARGLGRPAMAGRVDDIGSAVARGTAGTLKSINIRDNIREAERRLTAIERKQIPFAAALAMTKSIKDGQAAIVDEMQRVFDRPTRYTLNSTFIKPATKRKLEASVAVRETPGKGMPPANFLDPQTKAGGRRAKGFERALRSRGLLKAGEFAMPSRAIRRNRFGNVTRGMHRKILSAVKADASSSSRISVQRNPEDDMPPGIYQRRGKKGLKPLFIFTKAPTYRKQLRFWDVAGKVAMQRMPMHFSKALRVALRTAKKR